MEMRVQEVPPGRVMCGLASMKPGKVLVGMTEEGEVCRVSFTHGREVGEIVEQWHRDWPGTKFGKGKIPKDFETRPLVAVGTELQRIMWLAMLEIGWGETITYGALAEQIGMPGRARAVGKACGDCRLAPLVPCHRVIGAAGIGGYGLEGMEFKQALLRAEGVEVRLGVRRAG